MNNTLLVLQLSMLASFELHCMDRIAQAAIPLPDVKAPAEELYDSPQAVESGGRGQATSFATKESSLHWDLGPCWPCPLQQCQTL